MSVIFNTTKVNISPIEWFGFLQQLDTKLHAQYDNKDIILLSAPTQPIEIKNVLNDFMLHTNNEDSLFCSDIILDFLIFNKKYVTNKVSNKCDYNKYDEYLCMNALIIIHIKSGDIFTLPRSPKNEFKLKFMNYPNYGNVIKDNIYSSLQISFPSLFNIMPQDWTKKDNFSKISEIGYLCDNGYLVSADVVRQKNNKIFVHFNGNEHHFGSKYKWITVPNDRISPPQINKVKALGFMDTLQSLRSNNLSTMPFPPRVQRRNTLINGRDINWRGSEERRNYMFPFMNMNMDIFQRGIVRAPITQQQEDDELARAIANSLNQS